MARLPVGLFDKVNPTTQGIWQIFQENQEYVHYGTVDADPSVHGNPPA